MTRKILKKEFLNNSRDYGNIPHYHHPKYYYQYYNHRPFVLYCSSHSVFARLFHPCYLRSYNIVSVYDFCIKLNYVLISNMQAL